MVYNRLSLERTELDNKKRYKNEDYQKLGRFYENKIQQIHIVGEYANKMIESYRDALQFVNDYFQLNYGSFLYKYFKGSREKEISRNITPAKFRQLFGELSPIQLSIINDNDSKYIVVAAGPGSGKTKVLVHKLASLLLMEDVKHEQLLMLTFSRAAATEFKKRLLNLIGNAAYFIDIKTFHSYCFDLLGRVGSIEKSGSILKRTIDKIKNKEVEPSRITKTVLVIDEAQDMDKDEFDMVLTLIDENEEMRVIAVGDDDQNIYQFRGSSSVYLKKLIELNGAKKYELVENYRSKNNIVDFANQFLTGIADRLKNTPGIAKQTNDGKISLTSYRHGNLITPLVNDVSSAPLAGTTCVLVKTNEEASQTAGLLLQNGMQAKLVQTNDSFNLFNLAEIRFFLSLLNTGEQDYVISDEVWKNALRKTTATFKNSDNWIICENLVRDFEATNKKIKYKSDLEVFIRESNLEDFYPHGGETIFVSTIHKAKGKEFDNVFLMLENMGQTTDDFKRQLYVAITRAKCNLFIHTNTDLFEHIKVNSLIHIERVEPNLPPALLTMHLTHKDVKLDYFYGTQSYISTLMAGNDLVISEDECLNANRRPVLKFSNQFSEVVKEYQQKGYKLKAAKVNFVLYWQKKDTDLEIKIVLPKVYFEKLS